MIKKIFNVNKYYLTLTKMEIDCFFAPINETTFHTFNPNAEYIMNIYRKCMLHDDTIITIYDQYGNGMTFEKENITNHTIYHILDEFPIYCKINYFDGEDNNIFIRITNNTQQLIDHLQTHCDDMFDVDAYSLNEIRIIRDIYKNVYIIDDIFNINNFQDIDDIDSIFVDLMCFNNSTKSKKNYSYKEW